MDRMKTISVVIAAYQAGQTIGQTLDSILVCPSPGEAEIIVVDDGCTDKTSEIDKAGLSVYPRVSSLDN